MKHILAAIGLLSLAVWLWLSSRHADAQLQPGRGGVVSLSPPMPASTPTQEMPVAFSRGNLSAFGDLVAVGMTPTVQLDFVYGINTQVGSAATVTTGSAGSAASIGLRLQTGIGTDGEARYQSRRLASYRPGQGIIARFTAAFSACTAGSMQFVGVGDDSIDGLGMGCNGATFGIRHLNATVDTWIPQSAWNGDRMDGTGTSGATLDQAKGNVYQLVYPYLGHGDIAVWAQDSTTSRWTLLHTIRYANSNATTEFANPTLRFFARVANDGNSSNVETHVGSAGIFITGVRANLGPKWGVSNNKTGIGATETVIVSLRNATTYNGVSNRQTMRIRSLSLAYANSNPSVATVRIVLNATIGGSPTYAAVDGVTADDGVTITSGLSAASFDTAGTTRTGGYVLHNAVATNGTSYVLDMIPFEVFLAPGETLSITGTATNAGQVGVGITWDEAN